ncbi:MAG: hypothetical protein EOM91_14300 [Sphingobacteriia bacterium]|nr:hypothetical protein [Sphingobacteriia bacterium]NCC40239.1 hypothetical protein [Gammaproteobacteria bacterium]
MAYATFKALQAILFFGSAMAFCLWQLAVIRRLRREDEAKRRLAANQSPGIAEAGRRARNELSLLNNDRSIS